MATASQQRQKGAYHAPRAEQVGLEGLADLGEIGVHGVLPGVVQDGGVVHEDVEPTERLRHAGPSALDAAHVGHVELAGQHRTLSRAKIRGGALTRGRVARPEQHRHPALGELTAHLEANPAVRPGDQCDPGALSAFSCHGGDGAGGWARPATGPSTPRARSRSDR